MQAETEESMLNWIRVFDEAKRKALRMSQEMEPESIFYDSIDLKTEDKSTGDQSIIVKGDSLKLVSDSPVY